MLTFLKNINEKGDFTSKLRGFGSDSGMWFQSGSGRVNEARIVRSMSPKSTWAQAIQVNRVDYLHHALRRLSRLTLGIPDTGVRLGALGLLMALLAPCWG